MMVPAIGLTLLISWEFIDHHLWLSLKFLVQASILAKQNISEILRNNTVMKQLPSFDQKQHWITPLDFTLTISFCSKHKDRIVTCKRWLLIRYPLLFSRDFKLILFFKKNTCVRACVLRFFKLFVYFTICGIIALKY